VTSWETRHVVLGHIQRGGRPTAYSRELALRLGYEAVNRLLAGEYDKAVGVWGNRIVTVNFELAIQQKSLDVDSIYNLIRILT
jgi:6-phosphofructokinase